jgi:DNA-binding response OmpR family regulator
LSPRILLLEDDPAIAGTVAFALQREGFAVDHVLLVAVARASVAVAPPSLAILDVGLPDGSGLDLCREWRQSGVDALRALPVLMLTARAEELDRVVGLELGADDYIVKPFGLRELVARIRAVTRRTASRPDVRDVLVVGGLTVDVPARKASIDARELQLTLKEFDLLALLASEPGLVVDRQRILREVWDTTWYGSSKTVDVHVAALRKKLGDPTMIETVRGVGLRLRA